MRRPWRHSLIILAAALLAGCGSTRDATPIGASKKEAPQQQVGPPGEAISRIDPSLSAAISMTRAPAGALRDGDVVSISGKGFEADRTATVSQCALRIGQVRGPDDCDLRSTYLGARSDAQGVLTGDFRVAQAIWVDGGSRMVDCAAPGEGVVCALVAVSLDLPSGASGFRPNVQSSGGVSLEFGRRRPAELSVSADGVLAGNGFRADSNVRVWQCAGVWFAPDYGCSRTVAPVELRADAAGSVAGGAGLSRAVTGPQGRVDCTTPGQSPSCYLLADDGERRAWVPVPPEAPAYATAAPGRDAPQVQPTATAEYLGKDWISVTVSGLRMPPGGRADVYLCKTVPDGCSLDIAVPAASDDGDTVQFVFHRDLGFREGRPFRCVIECRLVVESANGLHYPGLAFVLDAPGATRFVARAGGGGSVVSLDRGALPANTDATVQLCPGGRCDGAQRRRARTDAAGSLTVDVDPRSCGRECELEVDFGADRQIGRPIRLPLTAA